MNDSLCSQSAQLLAHRLDIELTEGRGVCDTVRDGQQTDSCQGLRNSTVDQKTENNGYYRFRCLDDVCERSTSDLKHGNHSTGVATSVQHCCRGRKNGFWGLLGSWILALWDIVLTDRLEEVASNHSLWSWAFFVLPAPIWNIGRSKRLSVAKCMQICSKRD